jgi:hypothetical protein
MSALISFIGGSAFRMIWGEVSAWFTRRQEQKLEIERMRLQGEMDAAAHARNMESIRLQADLGVKVIQAQHEADVDSIATGAWATLVEGTTKLTGLAFIDYWNAGIRPALATVAMAVVIGQVIQNGFVLSDWDKQLVGAILGIYVADRSLSKRGK